MKFIHAADLHIDSPLRGLDLYPGAPIDRLRGASRRALTALVDFAILERIAFVLFAGDIYDGNWAEFRTGLFFRDQLVRLRRAGIFVFIVKGNHDAESQITKQMPNVEGVKVFSSLKSETVDLAELGVAIHGRSFPTRAVPEDLIPSYPAAVSHRFNIGLLHTSLSGRPGHDTYAPTTIDALSGKGYDYFALGHVHAREVVVDAGPRIVFPGNLQGRHAKETGSKGCELVTVEGGVITAAEHISLEVVRWHRLEVDVTGIESVSALATLFVSEALKIVGVARDKLHAIRVYLHGSSPLHRLEAEQPGTLGAAIQAAAQDVDGVDVWVEEVRLDLRSPFDRATAAAQTDALGEVVRLVDSIAADETRLKTWFSQHLNEMKEMPPAFGDAAPTALDSQTMHALLADAEASILVQLSALEAEGKTA